MELSNEERHFVAKRAKLVQTWPYVGAMLLTMLVGLGVWLFLSKPLLANPFFVLSQLDRRAIPESTIALMAAMLPVVVLVCLGLAVTVVLFAFAAFSNEKKYLAIIQRDSHASNAQQDAA
ncbi:MAG: hypothetical protein KJZ87_01470 [Thermoguttaceae bacterium]|nr:hypothetical protein [Thermoguttaceae bacterium]